MRYDSEYNSFFVSLTFMMCATEQDEPSLQASELNHQCREFGTFNPLYTSPECGSW